MRAKTIKSGFIILFVLIAALSAALSVFFAKNKSVANGAELVGDPFKDEYSYNETIDMPSAPDVSYGGNTYKSKCGYIKFPDGKVYAAGKHTLTSYGVYSVIYEFDVDGKTESAEQSFTVNAASYTIGQNSEIKTDTLNADFGNGVSGLRVLLAANEAFVYNEPINVYNGGITELIKFNFMACDPVVRDAVIRLTDCYDPSVFVDIQYSKPAYGETYLLVGACGNAAFGVWNNAKGSQIVKVATINGEECKINGKGNMIPSNRKKERHPNAGLTRDRYNNISLSVDASNRDKLRFYVSTEPEKEPTSIISELNNPDIYGYEFGGFTTGEVILSVTAKSITGADYCETEIASIAGLSGDALKPYVVKDTKKPTVVVNAESRSLNVMGGVEVTLPEVAAYDASGLAGDPECLVYYGYGTATESAVEVKNGKFTPKHLGTYTAIYSVSDVFGNKTVEEVVFNAVKTGLEGIEFTYEKIENAVAGQIVSFANYTAKSLNSVTNVTAIVTDPTGKETTLVSGNIEYLLERAGKYNVKYRFFDGLYSGERSYEFDCADRGLYRIDAEKIYMPDYVIKGAEYSTDAIKAYRYGTNAPEQCSIKGYVSYDGGEYKEINLDKFVIESGSKLKIKVVCADDSNVFVESGDIKIVDVGYKTAGYSLTGYFAGDYVGSQSEETPDYTSYNLTNSTSGTLAFVNPLVLSCFSFRFSLSESVKTGSFTIVLTDYYNRGNKIKIKFGDVVTVNGREIRVTDAYSGTPISLSYASKSLSVGSTIVSLEAGFTTEKALFSVEFENITSAGTFNVYSVCGQSFGYYVKSDTILPMAYMDEIDKVAYVGDIFTLPKPSFADVLSPSSRLNCTVSVYKSGVSVKTVDGTELKNVYALEDYSFKIDGYGTYLIIYKYTDGAGKTCELRPTISVIDVVAPTIKLNDYNGRPVETTIGAVNTPLSYAISDNVSKENAMDVLIVVYNCKGVRVSAARDSFVISKEGKYTVYLYCFDEAGNTAYVSYSLIVK